MGDEVGGTVALEDVREPGAEQVLDVEELVRAVSGVLRRPDCEVDDQRARAVEGGCLVGAVAAVEVVIAATTVQVVAPGLRRRPIP